VRLPRAGSFCRIYWRDAQAEDKWTYGESEHERVIEITSGVFRRLDGEGRVVIDPTVSIGLDSGTIHGELSEIGIPLGCVVKVEKLPPADLTKL